MSKFNQKPNIYINGRFLVQRQTGVQRFAHEVVHAISKMVLDPNAAIYGRCVIVITPDNIKLPLEFSNLRHIAGGKKYGHGYLWEQFYLPFASADGVLLNLCNLAPLAKRRQVVVVHDATTKAVPDAFSILFRTAYSILIPAILKVAAKTATVSEFSRFEISKWFSQKMEDITVCYEGAEHILVQKPNNDVLEKNNLAKKNYILAVGIGAGNKNLALLIKAFSAARLDNYCLVLTGKRNSRIHGAEQSDFLSSITHVGHVSDAELRALYESAVALVYPSSYEGFGLPPIEAMACGCPVIISDQAALVEVADGAALVTRMGDSDSLSNAIKRLATDIEARITLKEAGLSRARLFTWKRTAEILLSEVHRIPE